METKTFLPVLDNWKEQVFGEADILLNKLADICGMLSIKETDTRGLCDTLWENDIKKRDHLKEVVDYLSKFWGKFVNIKITQVHCGETDFPISLVVHDYNVLLCSYDPEKHRLYGVFSDNINVPNSVECSDKYICLEDFIYTHEIEITEIEECDFYKSAIDAYAACVSEKKKQINLGTYTLTENGYETFLPF